MTATCTPERTATDTEAATRRAPTWPGNVVLALVSVVGVMAFTWPFFATSELISDHSEAAPWLFAALGQRSPSPARAGEDHAVTTSRFAPSPTGRLHLGNAYSAVLGRNAASRWLR